MLPIIARVRVIARTLLVDLGIICAQRAEMRDFMVCHQDIFAVVSHLDTYL